MRGPLMARKIPRTTKKLVYHLRVLVDDRLNPIYEAAIEATEEAILNSLCMARDMDGANGNFAPALPLAEVKDIVERSAFKMAPKPQAKAAQLAPAKPVQPPPAPRMSESPRVGEAPPSAARGAEGMMTVPLPKPDGSSS